MKPLKAALDVVATLSILGVAIVMGVTFVTNRGDVAANPRVEEIESVDIALDSAASRGDVDATVGMVMFSDFQCPFCRNFTVSTLPDLQKRYVDSRQVRVWFKHFPLESIHSSARLAGELAACAHDQGLFWRAHDFLFDAVGRLANVDADDIVANIGVSSTRFNSCLESGTGASIVNADLSQARKLRVSSTPVFFIGRHSNGMLRARWRITGAQPFAAFEKVLDDVLAEER